MSDNQYIEKGKRLRKVRESLCGKDKTLVKFAEEMGMIYSNYSRIESGHRDIPTSLLEKLADVSNGNMKVNLNYLLTGNGDPFINTEFEILNLEEPNVRFLNISAFAGHAIDTDMQELSKWVYIPGLQKKGEYYGLTVEGKSMVPTLLNGDLVVCKQILNVQDEFDNGEIYVVVLNDKILIKRLFLFKEGFELHSDNPLFNFESVRFDEVIKLFTVISRITPIAKY